MKKSIKIKKQKRLNFIFNENFISCNNSWGAQYIQYDNRYYYYIYNNIINKYNKINIYMKNKYNFKSFLKMINKLYLNIISNWYIRLRFQGFGYKYKIFFKKLRIYLGYSHNIDMIIPKGIICFKEKKKRYNILLYSLDSILLKQFVLKLKNLRSLNNYKIYGIVYTKQKEKLKLKPGKQQYK